MAFSESRSSDEIELEEPEIHEVTPEEAGSRLDQFCQAYLQGLSRARCQALIEAGHIRLGDRATKPAIRLRQGDKVLISLPDATPSELQAEAIPLSIAYEDMHFLVVDKPQGMVVHPAPGAATGTLVNALLAHCKDLSGIGGVARPGIVHRLDKDTSGLLVVAKHDEAHRHLSSQIASKTALRQYVAVVRGHLPEAEGRVEGPIARHPSHRKKMAVVAGGRAAATRYRVLEDFKGYQLVELTLETGRTHQIRVHMAHLGHAVVGDPLYGGETALPVKLAGQALHARRLDLIHPMTGEALSFEAEPPESFKKLLNYLRQMR